jgi:hypothetical protein
MGDPSQPSQLASAPISFLGQPIEHRDSLRAMLGRSEEQVAWVGDVTTFCKKEGRPGPRRFQRLWDQLGGTHDSDYLRYLTDTIDRAQAKLVIAFWGTTPLPDVVALKKKRPRVKIVFMVLCHPLAAEPMGVARQNYFIRRAARYLDAILYPSAEMREYFNDRILRRELPSTVIPPCWPASFQSATRAAAVADCPNLIYTGRTDFNGWGAQATDDTRPLMKALLDAGIELHHGSTPESEDGHPRRKTFKVVSLKGLIEMIGGYDASLIAYNIAAAKCDERFRFTVFDRLLTSVTAGVPIAIPKVGYPASKSYLREGGYPIIEFDSPRDLHYALSDRAKVNELRDQAWNARSNFQAERHGPALRKFLNQLL